jgi:simple sugar transport system permease protein
MISDLIAGAFNRSVAYATPILWVALGEICVESAGLVNIALDGMMVMSALAAFVVANLTHSLLLGLVAGAFTGVLTALPHAFASITLRVDQFVIGLALAMLCRGLASLLGRDSVGKIMTEPLPSFSVPYLDQVPFLGQAFFTEQCVLSYVLPFLALALTWFFFRTRPGILWRSCGESPAAVDACGIPVVGFRYAAMLLGGFFAGIGGAYLSLYYEPAWAENITGGMGWVALAIVIFSRWHPLRAGAGALLFGVLYHFSFRLQEEINPHLLKAMPYLFVVLTLFLGSWRSRNGNSPQALGLPYFREDR